MDELIRVGVALQNIMLENIDKEGSKIYDDVNKLYKMVNDEISAKDGVGGYENK